MKLVFALIVSIVTAVAAPVVKAQPAKEFGAACLEVQNMRPDDEAPLTVGQGICLSAFETFHWFASVGELHGREPFCIPPDVTTREVVRTFVRYLLKHQELFEVRAQFVMERSMHDRWPC